MKKQQLLILPLVLAAGTVMAADVYDDGQNKVTMGGRAEVIGQAGDNADGSYRRASMSTGSTRVNIGFERKLQHDWTAEALVEWQVNMLASNDQRTNPLTNRLGYLGFKHDIYGQFRAGKQWAAVYDVFGATDDIYISDPDASGIYQFNGGADGGTVGTGRMDHSGSYVNQFAGLTLGLQYGLAHTTIVSGQELQRGHNAGASLSYTFDNNIKVGLAHSATEIDQGNGVAGLNNGDKITSTAASASYQGDALHMAATLVDGENYHNTHFQEGGSTNGVQGNAQAGDIYAAYRVGNFEPYGYVSTVSFDGKGANTTKGDRNTNLVGVMYHMDDKTQVGIEYRNINTIDNRTDQNYGLKVRYFF